MQSTVAKANEYFIITFILSHLFIQFSLSPSLSLSLSLSLSHTHTHTHTHTHWLPSLCAVAIYPLLQCRLLPKYQPKRGGDLG